ncbi:cardiolipin synthase [Clostridium sp. AM32-2]|jgi:cardiolipin synthase|nr:cardiolipin synthase [Clostridium sp. AM32-2]RHT25468.1 cardiolipin synthase [Clostridium sp. AM32-2]
MKSQPRPRSLFRIIFGRTTFVILGLLLQIAFFFSIFRWLGNYIHFVYITYVLVSSSVVIAILNRPMDSSFKMAWIIPVLLIPIFGIILYVFVQVQFQTRALARRVNLSVEKTKPYLVQDPQVQKRLRAASVRGSRLVDYMNHIAGFPVYENTAAKFFPLGEDMFEQLMEELKAAKHFIFMEYFIIDRGYMWDSILEVLRQKAEEGVEVRVMYDGMCCLMLLPYHYPQKLENMGIRCQMFSPIKPVLSTHQNYRDHRKVTVIDGHTAFTGGVNLADEYINRKERFGHWKDTAIMIKGDAVKSFTMMFLQMWDAASSKSKNEENYEQYLVPADYKLPEGYKADGFVMPYADSPLDEEQVGEQVYLDILNQAKSYVHIITPYLILDDGMKNAMAYAAKRGIDVKIIMPHIPDKKYAYLLARTYYPELIASGVKIYEYEPGFTHAKIFVSDDEKAAVGSINLDFRSLYLHFECGTYLYRNSTVADVEKDFENTLEKCIPVTLKDCAQYNWFGTKAGRFLRLIAPLM